MCDDEAQATPGFVSGDKPVVYERICWLLGVTGRAGGRAGPSSPGIIYSDINAWWGTHTSPILTLTPRIYLSRLICSGGGGGGEYIIISIRHDLCGSETRCVFLIDIYYDFWAYRWGFREDDVLIYLSLTNILQRRKGGKNQQNTNTHAHSTDICTHTPVLFACFTMKIYFHLYLCGTCEARYMKYRVLHELSFKFY